LRRPDNELDFVYMMKFITLILFLSSFSLPLLAKSEPQTPPSKVADAEKKVHALNKDLSCSTDNDCAVLPFGYKACGGPRSYLIASKKNPQFTKLKAMLVHHSALEKKESDEQGLASTCEVPNEPFGRCMQSKCQASFSEI
jgi:hypothetical protein